MIQILYEPTVEWPKSGPLRMDAHYTLSGEITVSPDEARRAANGYLVSYVGFFMEAAEPCLVWRDYPIWRFSIYLHLRGLGQVARLGEIEVDGATRRVTPLANEKILQIQTRANEIATRLTFNPAPAS